MRDANRVYEVLDRIGKVWGANPDMRLGQLILNCVGDPLLYYIEDEKLADKL